MTAAPGSDVPRSRRDGNPPVHDHAGLGQVYPPAGLDHGDLNHGLAERDGAKHVDRDAADPKRPLDSLVDHMGKKGSRWSAVLSRAVPRALSRPGRLVSPVPAGEVIGRGFVRPATGGASRVPVHSGARPFVRKNVGSPVGG